jgi:2-furoyl-CoA dehydrogenase large subunit
VLFRSSARRAPLTDEIGTKALRSNSATRSSLVGASVRRKEDFALLTGRGRFADDLPVAAGTLSAHVVRSPHAHALIRRIDKRRALSLPGVHAVITGDEIRRLSDPFLVAVKEPVPQWSLAAERVRYFGEPVALVLASNRYLAEDAATEVEIDYEPLSAVLDPLEAMETGAPRLHDGLPGNQIGPRKFVYGDPDAAFSQADAIVKLTTIYPRNSFTPIECFVVAAEYRPADGS